MIEFLAGGCFATVCLAILIPNIPFILWMLGFVDMGMNETTPAWLERIKRRFRR
jgi:hypothetical protein